MFRIRDVLIRIRGSLPLDLRKRILLFSSVTFKMQMPTKKNLFAYYLSYLRYGTCQISLLRKKLLLSQKTVETKISPNFFLVTALKPLMEGSGFVYLIAFPDPEHCRRQSVHSDCTLLAGVWGWKGGVRAAVTAPSWRKPRVQTPRPQPPTDTPRLAAGRAERGWRLIWPARRPLIRYRKHK